MTTGYKGILSNRGKFVEKSDAIAYALSESGLQVCDDKLLDHDMVEMVEYYFFSGDWILVNEGDENAKL